MGGISECARGRGEEDLELGGVGLGWEDTVGRLGARVWRLGISLDVDIDLDLDICIGWGSCVVRWLGYRGTIMDNMASVLGGYLGNPPHYSHILGGRTYNMGTSCLVHLYL